MAKSEIFHELAPDWHQLWTGQQAEDNLQDFTFMGPGWYLFKNQTILAVAVTRPQEKMWNQITEDLEEKFQFFMYNGRNPVWLFNEIINAPTRSDERQ